jgi:hypothetical protein
MNLSLNIEYSILCDVHRQMTNRQTIITYKVNRGCRLIFNVIIHVIFIVYLVDAGGWVVA